MGRPAARVAIAAAVAWSWAAADDFVCQVMTRDNASLQSTLGIECNVTQEWCNCSSTYINGALWLRVSRAMNGTMKRLAPPGEWFIRDSSGSCVMQIGNFSLEPTPQPCPPGFYCSGGLAPPRSCRAGDHCPGRTPEEGRRCPTGFFCPLPGLSPIKCPDGAQCMEGSTRPNACQAGTYCSAGFSKPCPPGSYCPFGSTQPRKCQFFAICPESSKSEDVTPHAALFLAASAGAAYTGARFYGHVVRHGAWVSLVCGALVAVMWAVDFVIAGFLSLVFVVVAANWALLRIGTCPPLAARLLLLLSLLVAVILLGMVNPPWSLLASGMAMCSLLGWLMSRQNIMVVMIGRTLLVVAYCAMFMVYSRVDPAFTVFVGSLLLLTFSGLLASWGCEQRRQRRRVTLPFLTRWHRRNSIAHAFSLEQGRGSFGAFSMAAVGEASRQAWLHPSTGAIAPACPTILHSGASQAGSTSASTSSSAMAPGGTGSETTGVSFSLEDVSFDLPDGKRLLREVSLRIGPGRRVAVMGPSGSGKSTLLAVLSGRASYGRVGGRLLVSGRPTDDLRFLQHVTGFVPQDDVLHGELTVEENVRFQAALRLPEGTSDEQLNVQVAQVAKDLQLSSILGARVGTPERRGVSGGQRKRVSIAMELVAQPLLLFADEPTSGLDSTTSHDVVRCLNEAAARLGTTVIAVIHQPRYDTLRLFDDLVLLGGGGCLVFAGPSVEAVEHFQQRLQVDFPPDTNPADVLLDAIQPPRADAFAEAWRTFAPHPCADEAKEAPAAFYRQRPPFFRAVLIYMDRSMLQCLRAYDSLVINQALCIATTWVLCFVLKYERLDQFVMQSAFAALFLMLLQGVAAQRIFGADLLVTWREARVGMPMVAYLVAKDLAALFEVTLSAAVFTATYGSQSGAQLQLHQLLAGSWAFVYAVFGLSYIFSIVLSPGAAQMTAVVASFLSFCVAGVYQPQLPEIAAQLNGRGWMIPALSPVRWLFGFLLTAETGHLTAITRTGSAGTLRGKGYDLKYLEQCTSSALGVDGNIFTLQQAWENNRGWVCSTAPLLLLGVIFRFLAVICLMLYVHAQTSGWARFFGQSDVGAWKLAGRLFALLVGSFLALFLFAEVWTFGILRLDVGFSGLLPQVPNQSW